VSTLAWGETMRGRVALGAEDYNQGWWQGTPCSFRIDVRVADVDRFIDDPDHLATCTGTLRCDALGGRMAIERGTFNLLEEAGGARRRRMRYRLFARDGGGRELTLSGFKNVEDDWFRDTWADTTTLFTSIYPGHVDEAAEDGAQPVATGILKVSCLSFMRLMLGMRGRLRDKKRFFTLFSKSLLAVYLGPPSETGEPDFPARHPGAERWQGRPPGEWHDCPGRPGLRRRIIGVGTADGRELTVHNIRAQAGEPADGPVLLAHGTGTRAEIFYGAPIQRSIVDALVEAGFDVWVANWRGSIDLPACDYVLDEVARFDHPALIAAVLRETGAQTLKALVHCQGSTSFALAAAAGLVPQVTDVVSTSVSYHVDVPRMSKLRMRVLLPLLAPGYPGFDPQWGVRPTALRPRLLAAYARLVRRECREPVCQVANYVYGAGGNVLWDHANIDEPTHEWISREFGWVPTSFFKQMARCARAGHLVAADGSDALPQDAVLRPPADIPRWTLVAGTANRCFLSRSQERTFAWLERLEPGRHRLELLPRYTHLDLFFGRDAARDVFDLVVRALQDGTSTLPGR
jgi:alpha/beta hydrolase fold